jgi:hypothetical protein
MRRQAIDGRAYHIKPTGPAELKKGPKKNVPKNVPVLCQNQLINRITP